HIAGRFGSLLRNPWFADSPAEQGDSNHRPTIGHTAKSPSCGKLAAYDTALRVEQHDLRQHSVFENSPTSRRPVPPTDRTRSRSTNQRDRTSQASRRDRATILPQRIEATSVMSVSRCGWATNDPLYIAYHDREWGSPLHDDRELFELLILEGAQAGLSWITI